MLMKIRNDQSGLTLIETLVALSVLLIVSLGITPLMMTAMRGATLSRSFTVGKNIAVEAMERVRGLPYFVSVQGQVTPKRRDVLDLYLPDKVTAGTSGYQPSTFSYITRCSKSSMTPSPSAPLACPKDLPDGVTVTYTAAFVEPNRNVTPETFTKLEPCSGLTSSGTCASTNYSWANTSTELPRSNLIEMVIEVSWKVGARTRKTTLTSIVGERTVTPTQVQASGNVRFVVQASTSGVLNGQQSTLEATAGVAESKIENRQVAVADQSIRAGRLLLTLGDSDQRVDLSGATDTAHAPPNVTPFTRDAGPQPATLTGSSLRGYLGSTRAEFTSAQVVNELPKATGKFLFMGGQGTESFNLFTDVGSAGASALRLDPTKNVLELNRDNATKILGETRAEATALGTGRKVESYAHAQFGRLDLLSANLGGQTRPVVYVENFTATLICTSTAQATATTSGTWGARLWYWKDTDPNDGAANGAYTSVTLSGSTTSIATDPLAAIKAQNPLVYDDPDPAKDLYLFKSGSQNGYLEDWYSRPKIDAAVDAGGRITTASLDGALYVSTAPVDPSVPSSSVGVSVGSLACQAEDARGA